MIKSIGFTLTCFAVIVCLGFIATTGDKKNIATADFEKAEAHYQKYCTSCHGEKMIAFTDRAWKNGKTRDDLFNSIKKGPKNDTTHAFGSVLSDEEIYNLADYITTGIKNVERYASTEKPASNVFKTEKLTVRLDTVVKGINVPWGLAFLPNNEMLVTDRGGKLYHVKNNGTPTEVKGAPEVLAAGQGGLLDVVTDPGYAQNKTIYLSYSKPGKQDGKDVATTAIMKATFANGALSAQKDIFIAKPYAPTRHHYGSRMQFGRDGYLYFSVGDRGNEKENPQELKGNDLGKVHRIKTDGTAPDDNPFAKTAGAQATVYSYGHRNPQGMTIHPQSGKIYANEHGPRGGDEINVVQPGLNYGWPEITYGINYNGKPMAPNTKSAKSGMEQPFHQWTPSIGPSGIAFVTGNKYKGWEGNLLSGSLRFQYLNRTELNNDKVAKEEIMFKNIGRVRNVRMAPDGFIYIAVESPGVIYRLTPVE